MNRLPLMLRLDRNSRDGMMAAVELQTPKTSVQIATIARFFYAHGLLYGRECDGYKTRKGKKSAQLVLGLKLPPALTSNEVFKSRQGARP